MVHAQATSMLHLAKQMLVLQTHTVRVTQHKGWFLSSQKPQRF